MKGRIFLFAAFLLGFFGFHSLLANRPDFGSKIQNLFIAGSMGVLMLLIAYGILKIIETTKKLRSLERE